MKIFHTLIFTLFMSGASALATVTVSTPTNGQTVGSPVHYAATARTTTCSKGVAAMGVYVDNHLVHTERGASFSTDVTLSPGKYHTVVEEWDYCGGATYTSIGITVAASGGGVSVTSPINDSKVISPVHYAATARTTTCAKGVAAMGVYVDNHLIHTERGATFSTNVSLVPGSYHTVVEEWDYCGGALYTPVNVTVGSGQSGITSVQAACYPTTVEVNTTSQCHATVQGTGTYSSAVRWYASDGSINAYGLFTAPASAAAVTITATSIQNSAKSGDTTVSVQFQTPQTKHVVMVMEENQSYSTVVHNTTAWPHLNNLIANGSLPTHYYASTHPSIGNYFMLTTGQVLTNNDSSTSVWNVDNLARRMLASGVSFRVYAEGITNGYLGGNTGLYLLRHNPFARLSDIANNPQVARQVIWPFSQFATDVANGTLPEFSFIVPNIDDDAHNGTPQQADSWLQANVVNPLSSHPAFQPGGDGVLIVDFDEAAMTDTAYGGGHVSPVLWGPLVKAGYTQSSTTIYQHPSMLRTVMETLGLANPPAAAATAPSMSEFFVQK